MMILAEIQPVSNALLPLTELKSHLRLPEGFPEDGSQDERLEQALRSALSLIEARTGKALFSRQFRWQFDDWGGADRVHLPVSPPVSLDALTIVAADGSHQVLDVNDYSLTPDLHAPAIAAIGGSFPTLKRLARVECLFTAGFGADWTQIPPDLREAVLIMAASYFDMSGVGGGSVPGLPPAVQVLMQRYRGVSVGGIGA